MRRLVVAVLLSLPLAAACGSTQSAQSTHDGSGANIRDTLISAAGATSSAGSAKIAMTVSMSAAGLPLMTMDGTGVVQFHPRRSLTTIRYKASPMLGKLNGMRMTEVLYGSSLYLRSPLFTARAGKPWVKMTLDQLVPGASDLSGSGASDPTQVLGYLRSVSTSIQRVGSERVRGVETTHYRAVVDYAKMAGSVSPAAAAAVKKAIQVMGTSKVPMDVWLDGQNRAARIAMNMPMAIQGQKVAMNMSFDYFDFGTHVSVKAPPANQVADMSALLGTANTSTGSGSSA